jgi:hypothetical protein
MADLIQNYNFEDALYGNTYDAVVFNLPEEPAFSLDGAEIYMQLRRKPLQLVVAEFSSANLKIEIVSNYCFQLKTQVIEVTPDTYYYDILIVFADQRRETYIGGKWTIQSAITLKKQI